MITHVVNRAVTGMTDNADIAASLAIRYDPRITAADVARWRTLHRAFNAACASALEDLNAEAVNQVAKAIRAGDVATAKWQLERTTKQYQPSSKVQHSGRIANLHALLRDREYEERELIDMGVIIDGEAEESR